MFKKAPFSRGCASYVHADVLRHCEEVCGPGCKEITPIDLKRSREIPISLLTKIRKHGYLGHSSGFICSHCVEHCLQAVDRDEIKQATERATSIFKEELERASKLLRRRTYTVKELAEYNPTKWIDEMFPDSSLVESLRSLMGANEEEISENYALAMILERLVTGLCPRQILPAHLLQKVVMYGLSGKKSILELLSGPGGKSSYMYDLLKREGQTSRVTSAHSDIIVVFDNHQVIGRSWRVNLMKDDGSVPMSIVTMCIKLIPEVQMDPLQWTSEFRYSNWCNKEIDVGRMCSMLNETHIRIVREESLRDFVSACLKIVSTEENERKERQHEEDFIGQIVTTQNMSRCQNCGGEKELCEAGCELVENKKSGATNLKDVATGMSHGLVGDLMPRFPHKLTPCVACVFDPANVNPNNKSRVAEVLKHIRRDLDEETYSDERGSRAFCPVACDGLPFPMVEELVTSTVQCLECREVFDTMEAFKKHSPDHATESNIHWYYDWVVPMIGLGHCEMTLCKVFMKVTWHLFLRAIVRELNFVRDKAENCILNGADHHKCMDILQSTYVAVALELVRPYVIQCSKNDQQPTYEGFQQFCALVENQKFRVLQEYVFGFLHSIMLFRSACRSNNASGLEASFLHAGLLFFASPHSKYQKIYHSWLSQTLRQPQRLRDWMREVQCLSLTNKLGKCQGVDFLLEEVNKSAKSFVHAGVPTAGKWTQILRTIGDWTAARERLIHLTDTPKGGRGPQSIVDHRMEVLKIRVLLRRTKYLDNPLKSAAFKCLGTGHPHLSGDEIMNLASVCQERMASYIRRQEDPSEQLPTFTHPDWYATSATTIRAKKRKLTPFVTPDLPNTSSGLASST